MRLTENCPKCHHPPMLDFGESAICGNLQCDVIMWDPTKTADELLANQRYVSLPVDADGVVKPLVVRAYRQHWPEPGGPE